MISKENEQGPDRILLCSDEILAAAVRITGLYGHGREYGEGDGYGYGDGDGWGCGYVNGDGWGRGYGDGYE